MNDDGIYRINRNVKTDLKWIRPGGRDGIQDAKEVQILPVPISVYWTFTEDKLIFTLNNADQIQRSIVLIIFFLDILQLSFFL